MAHIKSRKLIVLNIAAPAFESMIVKHLKVKQVLCFKLLHSFTIFNIWKTITSIKAFNFEHSFNQLT